jgi:hypothetical protein
MGWKLEQASSGAWKKSDERILIRLSNASIEEENSSLARAACFPTICCLCDDYDDDVHCIFHLS